MGQIQSSVSPTPKIRLKGMAKTEVAVGNAPMEDLKPQFKEFLFYLAANSPVDRDAVLDVFWPDHRPGRQTANLHMAVYSLRQYLGKEAVQLDGNSDPLVFKFGRRTWILSGSSMQPA